jgi:hypothetical protein
MTQNHDTPPRDIPDILTALQADLAELDQAPFEDGKRAKRLHLLDEALSEAYHRGQKVAQPQPLTLTFKGNGPDAIGFSIGDYVAGKTGDYSFLPFTLSLVDRAAMRALCAEMIERLDRTEAVEKREKGELQW